MIQPRRNGSFKADNKEALKSSSNFRQVLHDLNDRRFMPLAIIAHSMGSVVVMHALYPDFSLCTSKGSRCQVTACRSLDFRPYFQ